MRLLLSIIAGATLALAAAACGGGPAATTGPRGTSVPPSAAAGCSGTPGTPVGIANLTFTPATVSVAVGGSVTWANADSATHTVTFDSGPDCGRLSTGGTVTRTFDAAGTFAYHCAIHTTMTGTVVVE